MYLSGRTKMANSHPNVSHSFSTVDSVAQLHSSLTQLVTTFRTDLCSTSKLSLAQLFGRWNLCHAAAANHVSLQSGTNATQRIT